VLRIGSCQGPGTLRSSLAKVLSLTRLQCIMNPLDCVPSVCLLGGQVEMGSLRRETEAGSLQCTMVGN